MTLLPKPERNLGSVPFPSFLRHLVNFVPRALLPRGEDGQEKNHPLLNGDKPWERGSSYCVMISQFVRALRFVNLRAVFFCASPVDLWPKLKGTHSTDLELG